MNARENPGRERNFKMRHIYLKTTLMAIVMAITLNSLNAFADDKSNTPIVNINNATAQELAYLPGIGPSTAERIIHYRKGHKFEKTLHITRVKGIGRKTYEKIKIYISINSPTTATAKIKITSDKTVTKPNKTTSKK